MTKTHGYAAFSAHAPLGPYEFTRRDPGEDDVVIDISHCGICHSDLHIIENDFGNAMYPVVPGHEIVGTVRAIGSGVTRFKVGDTAAVSTYIDSCGHCDPCHEHREHMCVEGMIGCFNGFERDGVTKTFGGYSNNYVAKQGFLLRVPETLERAGAAPLLCGGLTVYTPLRKWNVKAGMVIGVVGLGGLGHLAVKMAVAMGAEVVVFSTSASKAADAKQFGAIDVVVGSDPAEWGRWTGKLDVILDTVSALHEIDHYLYTLKPTGTLVLLGAPPGQISVTVIPFVMGEKSITGSMLGGLEMSQEMLDFCGAHNIVADVEIIRMEQINEAYERLRRNDVRYRFVIDMATLEG